MSNEKAFPRTIGRDDPASMHPHEGMDLRDYFAAKALQGIIAHFGFEYENNNDGHSRKAYQVADAMLKAREKQNL